MPKDFEKGELLSTTYWDFSSITGMGVERLDLYENGDEWTRVEEWVNDGSKL